MMLPEPAEEPERSDVPENAEGESHPHPGDLRINEAHLYACPQLHCGRR